MKFLIETEKQQFKNDYRSEQQFKIARITFNFYGLALEFSKYYTIWTLT